MLVFAEPDRMWVDFIMPDGYRSTVPAANHGKGWCFEDGPYDAYDHFHIPDLDDTPPRMTEWETKVLSEICPKLWGSDSTQSFIFHGESWTFLRNDRRDDCGREMD